MHLIWPLCADIKLRTAASAKGYMTNLLGEAFTKLFHEKTKHLEADGPRLLHVDSHSSHVNLPLLNFAVTHKIIVLGYPPHTTNLTQGLDVAVFGSFKKAYAKHAAAHYSATGQQVEKREFLTVLHHAVGDSFTLSNILSAWRKTGLRPPNRGAICDLDLAPSKAFSTTQILPLPPFSPIRAVVDAIHRQNRLQYLPHSPPPSPPPAPPLNLECDPSLSSSNTVRNGSTLAVPACNPTSALLAPTPPLPMDPQALTTDLQDSNRPEVPIESLCDDMGALVISSPPLVDTTHDTHAIYTAGEILRGIATTSLAPILEIDTVTSAIEPPPVELGPFPKDLVELLKQQRGIPSEYLWSTVKQNFIQLSARSERQQATNILQHTYCQQVQQKLAHKEKPRKQTTLQKVSGFENGLIFTSKDVMAVLARDAEEKELQRIEIEQKQQLKELKNEAKKWLEEAQEAQKVEYARLVAEWQAIPRSQRPTARQPKQPPLPPMPEHYKEALAKKQGHQPQLILTHMQRTRISSLYAVISIRFCYISCISNLHIFCWQAPSSIVAKESLFKVVEWLRSCGPPTSVI